MCGIVGWVDFDRDLTLEHGTVEAMTATMLLRGPDAGGTWMSRQAALGHRRLAVIDIEGGTQPMVIEVGPGRDPVVLVYSGEVYNFRELRECLTVMGHRFATRSDTEVVLRAYLEWGAGCVERFNGMFAFAIWDGARQELLLARDRLGIKPLYYHPYRNGLLFASEPKGILANPLYQPSVDEDALPILLNLRLALPGETPLRGLREVPAGYVVRVERRGHYEYPYWRLVSRPHEDSLPETVRTVRELLEDIVERQLVADVPVSSMLSGGLDSTTLAALATRALHRCGNGPLTTFCVDFAGADRDFRPTTLRPERDAPYARMAAQHIGTRHHDVVLDTAEILAAVPDARRARDLPSLAQFDASMYRLFATVKQHSTVSLSAEAADEIFGGYPWFLDETLVSRDRFPWIGDAPRLADCLAPDIRTRVRPAEAEADRYHTLRAQVPTLPGESRREARMREVLYFSLQRPLAHLLDRKDRMSMAVGLEVRVPFCDHRLVEYLWNVPWAMKTADGHGKSVLRMAARDLVPKSTMDRPKSGYPGTHDPAYEEFVLSAVSRILADPASPLYGLLDTERIHELTTGSGRTMTWLNAAHQLAPLVEVDAWMRAYDLKLS